MRRALGATAASCLRLATGKTQGQVARALPLLAKRHQHTSQSNIAHNLDPTVYDRYMQLPIGDAVMATYIWIDGTGQGLRCKTKTLRSYPSSPSELSTWNFDGSSTGQAVGHDSDVYIKPVSIFKDPFTPGNHCLVMCETLDKDDKPHPTNYRHSCAQVMTRVEEEIPMFGFEQEYTFLDVDKHPFGWAKNAFPGPQGPYYCSVGTGNVYGREVVDAHYRACLYAGIKVGGTNAEVMPAQWEYQVGPCIGVDMGDQLWVARYIMDRVAEDFGVLASLDPKPMPGDWNGAGNHCNYSTKATLAPGGIDVILSFIEKLSHEHRRHIILYDMSAGDDNRRRLTGLHETAHIDRFNSGVAHRGASVRIPRQISKDGKGYLEDRRPSSNCDPYLVTEAVVRSTLLDWNDFDMTRFSKEF